MNKKTFLTKREIQIVRCISNGMSNKEIGKELHISHRTADTHRTNIMRKLKVNNAALLVKCAIEQKLI